MFHPYHPSNKDDEHLAEFLLDNNYVVDIDFKDSDGNTMLSNACIEKDTDAIMFLVEHGASVNSKNKLGLTPLMNLVLSEPTSSNTIEYLLDHGAKVNEQDNEGNTALHYALLHHCPFSIVQYLIRKGADTELKNKYGMTPLQYSE